MSAATAIVAQPLSKSATVAPVGWHIGTVAGIQRETRRAWSLHLNVPGWPGHRPGQHVDVRLTAEDGYRTERSYSIASPPEESGIVLTVERLDDGEVSPYLTGQVRVGDRLELRGPIGGHFVWDVTQRGPLLLVAGGSGIVPLMAMLRHRAQALLDAEPRERFAVPVRLLYSSRRWAGVIYREELDRMSDVDPTVQVVHTLTRQAPPGWEGFRRRIDREMLGEVAWPVPSRPRIFACGPTSLVESVADALVELGHDPALVKTERFGPTGGGA
jgi:ferredoxin-NADP reductase